ncbi:hypothetical protein U9M48_030632 [Paspalum notatum var. saurae]|uniref:Uncharacterized protein n=1 Tax=Paspalum notatum var. saurae TaxID=547442 RepID=A0AAQ3U0N0_PASNO
MHRGAAASAIKGSPGRKAGSRVAVAGSRRWCGRGRHLQGPRCDAQLKDRTAGTCPRSSATQLEEEMQDPVPSCEHAAFLFQLKV